VGDFFVNPSGGKKFYPEPATARLQVSGSICMLRLRFVVSQVRRKNKYAPNLGHPSFVPRHPLHFKAIAGMERMHGRGRGGSLD